MKIDERWSLEVIRKAEDLVSSDGVSQDPDQEQVWYAKGVGGYYRLQTDGESWITCTCPNGQRIGLPKCYHSAAVLLKIEEQNRKKPLLTKRANFTYDTSAVANLEPGDHRVIGKTTVEIVDGQQHIHTVLTPLEDLS